MPTLHINSRPVAAMPSFDQLERLYHTTLGGNIFEPAEGWVTVVSNFPAQVRYQSKFGIVQVEVIRAQYKTGRYTYNQIGAEYGCSGTLIRHMVKRMGAYRRRLPT